MKVGMNEIVKVEVKCTKSRQLWSSQPRVSQYSLYCFSTSKTYIIIESALRMKANNNMGMDWGVTAMGEVRNEEFRNLGKVGTFFMALWLIKLRLQKSLRKFLGSRK